MKNSKNPTIISSTLKTIASENLVTEDEILNAKDKPLEEVLNDQKEKDQKLSPESDRTTIC
jgi:hypothetical protein